MKSIAIITILQVLFTQIKAIAIDERGVGIANDDDQQPKGAPIGATSQFDPYSNISPLSVNNTTTATTLSTTKMSMTSSNTITGATGSTNIQWKLLLGCFLFAIVSLLAM
ncbi:conserved hypothetical protein [Candida albicans WO-1]|uniref:Uncharacterized protein n=1 Tax=Candida albicans (strain WO-1) TaxID=294748 RepID=C4YHU8_CANAW|nr:conserved hypothetical protein [Candida albicans WO-1]